MLEKRDDLTVRECSALVKTVRDPDALIKQLQDSIGGLDRITVSVDGWSGAGKSWLAVRLASRLHLNLYDLDQFLERNQGGYVEYIRYDRIQEAFGQQETMGKIVEGICVLEVFQRLGVVPEVKIYVKKLSPVGIWHPAAMLDRDRTAEEVIEQEKELMRQIAIGQGQRPADAANQPEPLDYEIIRYHHRHRPHETADFIFEWIEQTI